MAVHGGRARVQTRADGIAPKMLLGGAALVTMMESADFRPLRALHHGLRSTELMTEGQNLKLKRHSLAKESQESRRQRHQRRRSREPKEERQTQFISNFEVCESHRLHTIPENVLTNG